MSLSSVHWVISPVDQCGTDWDTVSQPIGGARGAAHAPGVRNGLHVKEEGLLIKHNLGSPECPQKKAQKILTQKDRPVIMNYQKILEKNPQYIDKRLLLIERKKEKLYQDDTGYHIEVNFSKNGEMQTHKVSDRIKQEKIEYSLQKIGVDFLGLDDPSVTQMLRYLVDPEMEIERIFNNLRYRYLTLIKLSGFTNPSKLISSKYNKSYLALTEHTVYQGPIKKRVDNDQFWKQAGFTQNAKDRVDFYYLKEQFSFILRYFRHQLADELNRIYPELIAIKPGFHELFVHETFFNEKQSGQKPRAKVFRSLRGLADLSTLHLEKMPRDINKNNYFSYGSCHVTEGPFVFRKDISTSYFKEIRKIKSRNDIEKLENNFVILRYDNGSKNVLNTVSKLEKTLNDAKFFLKFPI